MTARRRSILGLLGILTALALAPFSWKVNRVLRTAATMQALLIGKNGGTFLIVGLNARGEKVESVIPRIRAEAEVLRRELAHEHRGVRLEWTGGPLVRAIQMRDSRCRTRTRRPRRPVATQNRRSPNRRGSHPRMLRRYRSFVYSP